METFLHLSKVFSCSKHCIKQSYSFARPCVWPNTLRMLPCIMHGPLTPCKFENTWKVSSCHPNFHSLWWITKAKQFFAMERDFSIMRKSGASEIDTKIMMLPSYLTQQGICKGKKKKRFRTKSLSYCGILKHQVRNSAVLCRKHIQFEITSSFVQS